MVYNPPMTFTQFIIYGLAIFRIASLLTKEPGPFFVFKKFREWSGIRHDGSGIVTIIPDNVLAQALACIWCASLWVAFAFTIFLLFAPVVSLQIATIFALSTIAILVDTYIGKKKNE